MRFIINFVYYLIISFTCFLFIKYLLSPLLPFICAFIIVSMSRKIILRIEECCHSKKYASISFTIFLVLVLSLLVYGICFGLLRELNSLSKTISDISVTDFLSSLSDKTQSFFDKFSNYPIFESIIKQISKRLGNIDTALSSIISAALPTAVSYVMRFISFFPSAVIFLCLMFISMFYISNDYEEICKFLILQLPEKILDTFDETKNIISETAKELFKSYFLLTFITFIQLVIGFAIIGTDYALLLALVISIIDLLPILGTGTILLPWSAISFLICNTVTGACLVVLYAVITVFRQLAQPKIVGTGTGIPPLISLISIFLGLKFFGFSGIIIFPILVSTAVKLNKKGFIKIYKNFPEKSKDALKKSRIKFLNFKRYDN